MATKRKKPPPLYIVFSGDSPQFLCFTESVAKGWIGKNELTRVERYVPARKGRR